MYGAALGLRGRRGRSDNGSGGGRGGRQSSSKGQKKRKRRASKVGMAHAALVSGQSTHQGPLSRCGYASKEGIALPDQNISLAQAYGSAD